MAEQHTGSILVTGGAGYIGSHTVQALLNTGAEVVVVDNLATGHRAAVPSTIPFYQVDIADDRAIRQIVAEHKVEAVIHFAARSLVGESVAQPDVYFLENTAKTIQFVSNLLASHVKQIVFSSTAAVYGIPQTSPIAEVAEQKPINPYGASKLMIEQAFTWLEQAYGLRWIALRYSNAAGAALDGSIGEHHEPETHLIPLVLQAAMGLREAAQIFGTDYNTPDGTSIRDYVHVVDLAEAHVLAVAALQKGLASGAYNVGTGTGYSVRQIIETVKCVTGVDFPVTETVRRAGDPDELVAQADKIKADLGWEAKYSDLPTMIASAWDWHLRHPYGYRSKAEALR
ncbi:UDP-glucose 4-epimerase GalE [Tumebacillus algifaecis]|uniref:UDP-glucose 4-epimerase n=1 Tax=Tumebacillus algifaecis TaxID=1214604 RepID=A0A223CWP1_9BACL|nr:UDP-glucose 4-epimerase GalE [Tumebacillus algifaecis]ASS73692.1 UDP-glucose 4-epimerase GalE [Tumebacillus algifaecis]